MLTAPSIYANMIRNNVVFVVPPANQNSCEAVAENFMFCGEDDGDVLLFVKNELELEWQMLSCEWEKFLLCNSSLNNRKRDGIQITFYTFSNPFKCQTLLSDFMFKRGRQKSSQDWEDFE